MDKLKSSSTGNTVYGKPSYAPLCSSGFAKLLLTNAQRIPSGVKRIIGRFFDEPSVQRDIQQWPFTVVAGAGKQPRVEVQYNGETKKFDIEEISEMASRAYTRFIETNVADNVKKGDERQENTVI